MTYRRKLIEVTLSLDAINQASVREKSIRYGRPSTLHLWWARWPLAAARAVIFAQMVDDPSAHPQRFPTEEAQEQDGARANNRRIPRSGRAAIWPAAAGNAVGSYPPAPHRTPAAFTSQGRVRDRIRTAA